MTDALGVEDWDWDWGGQALVRRGRFAAAPVLTMAANLGPMRPQRVARGCVPCSQSASVCCRRPSQRHHSLAGAQLPGSVHYCVAAIVVASP